MTDEIRIPVNAKIPKSLHDSLVAAVEAENYKDKTACITEALEKLLYNTQEGTQGYTSELQAKENEIQNLNNVLQEKYAEIREIRNVLQVKDNEILRLQSVIQEAPDPADLAQIRARYEEVEKHNETLKAELERAGQREEDLKKVHNNYMLQVQTLINQKAIEAPGSKKPWWRFW
jgi:Arc/MetJ-type ribon-helix-helix transcriptional regulator